MIVRINLFFDDNSIDEFLAVHLLEHIQRPLDLMEELQNKMQ
ncbi:hypothetical protein [Bacillus thuringiensis]|nr:hypothetical protein [Bacillus thuringiensis]